MVAVAASLGGASLFGWIAVGCGGDDNKALPTADSGPDVTTDTGGHDVMVVEASDAGSDVLDAANDTNLGSDGDSGPAPGEVFALAEATAFCKAELNCCPGGLDSGTYDLNGCIGNLVTYGWEGTLPSDQSTYSRGHVVIDQAKASQCLAALANFPCGTQTGAQWGTITQACELVITGNIPVNQTGCSSSWECAPNSYCQPSTDGGLFHCQPLAAVGQPCNTDIHSDVVPLSDQMCSYLGSGQPALFCDLIDEAADAATCQPVLANGANCFNVTTGYYDDQACPAATPLCGDNSQCGGTASYPYPAQCAEFVVKDAGGGG
jgi:hypothetical protein